MDKYDELIKRLREEMEYRENFPKDSNLMREAADAIEELTHENESLAKSVNEASEILHKRWIPVTEALPERNGTYLVYVYGDVTDLNYWCGKWHRLGDDHTKAVTHWMPLPEPPKEEK